MKTRPKPYLHRDPGDVIRSGDWNELQVQAREEVHGHRHTGNIDGLKIPRDGIEPKAIDGTLIDPEANVVLNSLSLNSKLTVKGKSMLTEIDNLLGKIKGLDNDKANRTGDTFSGPLTINDKVSISGNLDVKNDLNVKNKSILGEIDNLHGMIKGLESDKVNRTGDTINGPLTVNGNVDLSGNLIRKVAIATGLGPGDRTNNGQIKSRVLDFTKHHTDTAIRVLYCDNFRIASPNGYVRWEIRVNGKAPPGGGIYQDIHAWIENSVRNDQIDSITILGYAIGLPAGTHQIQVWVVPLPGYDVVTPLTGWNNTRWTIEAEEVRI